MSTHVGPLVTDVFPQFMDELRSVMQARGRTDLADQIPHLTIFDRCHCELDDCATFCTAQKPSGSFGSPHQTLEMSVPGAFVVLDMVADQIVGIEVLECPPLRAALDRHVPLRNTPGR